MRHHRCGAAHIRRAVMLLHCCAHHLACSPMHTVPLSIKTHICASLSFFVMHAHGRLKRHMADCPDSHDDVATIQVFSWGSVVLRELFLCVVCGLPCSNAATQQW